MPTGTGSVAVRISPSGTAQQKHSATGSAAVHPSLTGLGGPVYAANTIARLELWTDIQANGGTRLLFLPDVSVATSVLSIDGTESLSVVIPGTAAAATVVRENYIIRVWRSDGDFDEWAIGPLLRRRDRGGRVELTAQPLIYRLGTCGFVTEYLTTPLNGLPQLDVGVSAKTPTEIIQAYILDHPAIKAVIPWLTLGEITPTTPLDLSWSSATPLQVLRALSDGVQATGELCELRLRRVGVTSYAIDLVTQVGSANTTVSLRLGRNLESLEFKTDPTDRSTRIAPVAASLAGFPTFLGAARWKVTSVNSGAKTVVLEDPAGGAGPIGFDDQLIGWYLVRESTSASALITDSVESTQTLTLSAFLTGLVAGEYVGVRTTEPATGIHSSGNGEQPYYLEHPIYAASVDPGIGVKFGTIDRSTVVGVPNLVPNALTRTYTTPTNAMPDGWTFTSVNGVSIAIPVTETFEQNTDPLYTQLGGSSLHFITNGGFVVTPPIKFAPTYLGQMISCRIRLLLTSWVDAGAQMVMTLGIRRSDGGIHYWYEQDRRLMLQPGNARPTSTWKPLASGTWVDLELSANDITQPSTESSFPYKVTQADIDALATDAEGLVIQLWFDRDATGTAIEGYLDAAWMSPSIESPDEITEFGGANALWQATNVALGLLAPPQVTYNVGVVDLARLGVAPVTTDQLTIGCPVLVSDVELGLSNVPQRVVEMKTNHLKPGDTVITLAARNRRLTEMFLKGQQSTNKALSSGLKSLQGGGTPTTTTPPGGGTSGHPSIILTYVFTGDVPAIIATVSTGVISVKFAVNASAYPSAATVRLASADTTPPFVFDGTDNLGGAMTPGDYLYVSAFAYDNNGVESALATLLILDPVTLTGCALSSFSLADTPYVQGDDFAGGNPPLPAYTNTADFDAIIEQSGPLGYRGAYGSANFTANDGVDYAIDTGGLFHGHPTLKMAYGNPTPLYDDAGWICTLSDDADPEVVFPTSAAQWARARFKTDSGIVSGTATTAYTGLQVMELSKHAVNAALYLRGGRLMLDFQTLITNGSSVFTTNSYDLSADSDYVGASDFGEAIMLFEGDAGAHTARVRVWSGVACALTGVSPLIDQTLTAYNHPGFVSGNTPVIDSVSMFACRFTPTGANKFVTVADWETMPTSVDANPFAVSLT